MRLGNLCYGVAVAEGAAGRKKEGQRKKKGPEALSGPSEYLAVHTSRVPHAIQPRAGKGGRFAFISRYEYRYGSVAAWSRLHYNALANAKEARCMQVYATEAIRNIVLLSHRRGR